MCLTTVVVIGPRPLGAQGSIGRDESDIDSVSWLSGCWHGPAGAVQEFWTDGAGGQMLGVNRSFQDGRVTRWEFLRIFEGRTRLILASAPSHQPPAEFDATVATADSLVFQNAEHDFPTHITYRRVSPDSLIASISGPRGDGQVRRVEFRFRRASCDAAWR